MKICLLSYRGNPYCGGQGIYLMYLANELVKLGHEVHIVVGPPYPDSLKNEGVTIHKIGNHNYFNKKDDFVKAHKPFATLRPFDFYEFIASKFGFFPEIEGFSVRVFLKLKYLLKKYRFDIIHDNQCLGYGFLLIKNFGIPFISTIHHPLTIDRSTWFEHPSFFRLKVKRILYYPLLMQRYVSKKMDKIISVSHDSAKEIEKAFGVESKKIDVIYNGLDSKIFYPLKGVKKRKNSLIFVGNVEDRKKGISYLLKALSLTKNRVFLTVVDGGAPKRSYVPQWIKKFNLNDRIIFTGKISIQKLLKLYAESEIALNPSLYEGFGFPAAEAMACELPVISTDGGALPEVVGNHLETAYLVPTRDAKALAEGIDFFIDNPVLRKKIGKAGRKRILEKFSWEEAAKSLEKSYQETIDAYR